MEENHVGWGNSGSLCSRTKRELILKITHGIFSFIDSSSSNFFNGQDWCLGKHIIQKLPTFFDAISYPVSEQNLTLQIPSCKTFQFKANLPSTDQLRQGQAVKCFEQRNHGARRRCREAKPGRIYSSILVQNKSRFREKGICHLCVCFLLI